MSEWLICPMQESVILVEAGTVNRLVIFNSHARKRQEMVTFRLSAFSVKVGYSKGTRTLYIL
jgi:hypothetical protein